MRFLLLLLVSLLAVPQARAQESLPTLTIVADSNLALPLARITRAYARDMHVAVAVAPTDTENISTQIAEGSAADLLITARGSWLEMLKQQGLVDIYSETPVTADRLALVGPKELGVPVKLEKGLPAAELLTALGEEAAVVIGHPEIMPEAAQAREALKFMRADADLEPHTLYVRERSQIYALLKSPHAIGLLALTDARRHGLHVLGVFPDGSHAPIAYRAVVLAGENMAEARRFIDYLKAGRANAVFAEMGFANLP